MSFLEENRWFIHSTAHTTTTTPLWLRARKSVKRHRQREPPNRVVPGGCQRRDGFLRTEQISIFFRIGYFRDGRKLESIISNRTKHEFTCLLLLGIVSLVHSMLPPSRVPTGTRLMGGRSVPSMNLLQAKIIEELFVDPALVVYRRGSKWPWLGDHRSIRVGAFFKKIRP